MAIGAALGILAAGGLSLMAGLGPVWLIAPLGASAVLIFGLPNSPLAQPWAVVAGNTVAALVGWGVWACWPSPLGAAALAVGLAIVAMLLLRCLHPPGGAVALLSVILGVQDWTFALYPVLLNSLLLVIAGTAYNRLTGRPYPHRPAAPAAPGRRFSDADISAVLARHNALMHTPRDELEALLEEAEARAITRRLHELRCSDIMTREPITVEHGTSLSAAWALLHDNEVKALPVLDVQRRVVGLLAKADFLRGMHFDMKESLDGQARWSVHAEAVSNRAGPAVVGQIMSRRVRVASADRSLADVVPIFSETGHHHLPVIDEQGRLVGVLTQTDVVRALRRVAEPAQPASAAMPTSPV